MTASDFGYVTAEMAAEAAAHDAKVTGLNEADAVAAHDAEVEAGG